MLNIQTSVTTSILYQDYNPMKSRHLNEVIFTHATCLWTGNHRKRQFVIQNGGHWANHSKLKVGGALTGFVHGDYFIISQNKTKSVILGMLSFHVCKYTSVHGAVFAHWDCLQNGKYQKGRILSSMVAVSPCRRRWKYKMSLYDPETHIYIVFCM